jgi:hypothetical protein
MKYFRNGKGMENTKGIKTTRNKDIKTVLLQVIR